MKSHNKEALDKAKEMLENMPDDEFLELHRKVEKNIGPTVEDFGDKDLSNYQNYRGKCKEYCEELVAEDPELRMVRGFYNCPIWGKEQHWWCEYPDGRIIDPTVKQFPSWQLALQNPQMIYEEFDGICTCDECGKKIREEDARFDSRYVFCSSTCNMRFVGL